MGKARANIVKSSDYFVTGNNAAFFSRAQGCGQWGPVFQQLEQAVVKIKRVGRSAKTWRELFSRQASTYVRSGLHDFPIC